MRLKEFSINEIEGLVEEHRRHYNYEIKLAIIGKLVLKNDGLWFYIL